MHEDDEDDGKGILKKALIFRLQHPSIQGSLLFSYHRKEKEEKFAICSLIERVSRICISLYVYVINNFDKKFISCFYGKKKVKSCFSP